MGDVLHLTPNEIGSDFRFNSDELLESMKGKTYDRLLVIGQFEDGSYVVEGNCNSGEVLFLMEIAKRSLVFGE